MSLPYYKFFPSEHLGNYQEMSLSNEMLGCYYRLAILQLWQHHGRIPDDPAYLASLLNIPVDTWQIWRKEYMRRGLIQIIDEHVTVASLRLKWEAAKDYSEAQSDKRKGILQKRKEKQILRKIK